MNRQLRHHMKTTDSPEHRTFRIENQRYIVKIVLKAFYKIYSDILHFLGRYYYSRNSDKRTLTYDWNSVPYNRIALVNKIVSLYENPSYLEIGCAGDVLFKSVNAPNKIGVDPAAGGTNRMTSDQFFETNSQHFDVVFIDGLHTYNQVWKDVENSLRFLKRDGFIVLHDMIPNNWIEQHCPIITNSVWTGDVWKLSFDLVNLRGADYFLVSVDHGIGVLRKSEGQVQLLPPSLDEATKYSFFLDNINNLPIVDWNTAMQYIVRNG